MTVIAVLGFPKSGKSSYLAKLHRELQKRQVSFFVQRACPDGEGQWTFESPNGKELAREHKKAVERFFAPSFVQWVIESTKNLQQFFDVVYLDCGGKQSPENAQIIAAVVDEAIIIARTKEDADSWERWVRSVKPSVRVRKLLSVMEDGELKFVPID